MPWALSYYRVARALHGVELACSILDRNNGGDIKTRRLLTSVRELIDDTLKEYTK